MSKSADLLSRIARTLGGKDSISALQRLSPRDLNSLLLHLFARRSEERSALELLASYEDTPAFSPGFVDQRQSLRFTLAALEAAVGFEAIELSPVCPLGTIHVLSGIHQNNVLSASRGGELVADPTPVLALECARRRKKPDARGTTLRLCTSQRLMRMQPAPAGLLPHFRLFALVTAARQTETLEVEALREHLAVYLRLFARLSQGEYRFADITVSVAHTGAIAAWLKSAGVSVEEVRQSVRTTVWADPDALLLQRGLTPARGRAEAMREVLAALPPSLSAALCQIDEHVLSPLAAEFPFATVRLDLGRMEGLGYYAGPCVRITIRDGEGTVLPLVDGGFTTWTQTLLSDRRERFLITGIGGDLLCARLRK
jgi:hypothetical protein